MNLLEIPEIQQAFCQMQEMQVGMMKLEVKNASGNPIAAIILLHGEEETGECIKAIDAAYDEET